MINDLRKLWHILLLRGIIALIAGIVIIAWPIKSLFLLATIFGLLLLIDGVILCIASLFSIRKDGHWWMIGLQGIFSLLVGTAIFSWPKLTVALVFFFLAIWAIFSGIILLATAIAIRKETFGSWLILGTGIISLLFGIFLLSNPFSTFIIMTVLIGLFLLVSGIMTIAMALEVRHAKNQLDLDF